MTLNFAFHTLVWMFTEAQSQYLTEVLGVVPESFLDRQAGPQWRLLVLTKPLSEGEGPLLSKILASVNLHGYHHEPSLQCDLNSRHLLTFGSTQPHGRTEVERRVWWSAPALGEMLGNGPDVTSLKKFTWTLLQQLAKELA